MSFLRRLFGGTGGEPAGAADEPGPADAGELEADERARELDLAREDQRRLDDLARRQLRYANYAWTPPAEGGDRRSDDEDATRTDEG